MIALRLCLLLLACGLATSELTKTSEPEKLLTTSASVDPEDDRNNPAKRDSSDQTASHNGKPKEEPFKPMYNVPYQEQPFRPTTIRYAASGAAPQAYYEKLDRTGGIQYAVPVRSQSVSPNGGILYASTSPAKSQKEAPQYASSAYRGPFNPNYQQAGHAGAEHQYLRAPPTTVAAPPTPPPPPQHQHHTSQIYLASDPVTEFMYGQIQQQLPPQIAAPRHPHPQPPPPSSPPQPRQQQKQIQYVIAIPVEYMRQLQQHLAEKPTFSAPVQALSTHAPESPGKTYQGIYKNLHYAAASPTEPPAPPTSPTAYMTQYIQVPETVLQSLGAPLYHKPQYQQTYYQQHQPAALHQRQQHHHQQQQQQQNAVYAYPFHQQQEQQQQQHYQLEQQHQPQQHQIQQQQHQQPIVRIGVAKASSSQVTAAHQHTAPSASGPSQSPPFIHYKPIYVQQQQQQGQLQLPMSFAHYHQHHLAASPYFIRQAYVPAAAGNIYPQVDSSLQHGIVAKMSFGYPYPPLQQEAAELPYFSHPGAVHYGTHLFHPPAPAASNQVLGPVATAATHQLHQQQQQQQEQQHQHQQQQQQQQQLPQQHQQQQQQLPPAAGSHSASRAPGTGLVKYP